MSLPHPNRQNAKPNYYAVRDLKKVVCAQQRAGTTSIVDTLRPAYDTLTEHIEPDEVLRLRKKGWPVLLWFRDPLEKFASAFSIFGQRRPMIYHSPDAFFEAIKPHSDPHWMPQTKCHNYKGTFLPTRVLLFEDIARTWPQELRNDHGKYSLQHRNNSLNQMRYKNSKGKTVRGRKSWNQLRQLMSSKTIAEILKYYEEDLVMHQWCQRYGVMEQAA